MTERICVNCNEVKANFDNYLCVNCKDALLDSKQHLTRIAIKRTNQRKSLNILRDNNIVHMVEKEVLGIMSIIPGTLTVTHGPTNSCEVLLIVYVAGNLENIENLLAEKGITLAQSRTLEGQTSLRIEEFPMPECSACNR